MLKQIRIDADPINPAQRVRDWPRRADSTPQAASSPISTGEEAIAVLLIDDRPIVGEAIRRLLLSETDIYFYFCSDPFEAVKIATEIQPTVILQDLVMSEIDGITLLRLLRANAATRDIPTIVLSTREDAQQKAEAFANGANDYLVKFPDKIELLARIRYHSTAYINFCKRHEAELALKYNKELERRVEQRTRELTEALETLKQTQAKLVHSEKMSGLGQLVAGVAHEINNPVSFIAGNIAHASQYTEDLLELVRLYQQTYREPTAEIDEFIQAIDVDFIREDLPKLMSSMEVGTDRIREIVLNLRNFSRMDEAEMKPVDLHEGIDSTLLILQHRLQASEIEVMKEYGALPKVECYARQLNQVFMNVLTNAIDAVESFVPHHSSPVTGKRERRKENGKQTLQTINPQPSTLPTIRISTEVKGNAVAIAISDNGGGIAPELQQRIFEPFFTTKDVGKGTGLGLSISYSIVVEKHGGVLRCESDGVGGTQFWIEIPIEQDNVCEWSAPAVDLRSPPSDRRASA